jgi:hypothetical protein
VKLIFICAPYRASTKEGVDENIDRASKLGIDVVNVLGQYQYFPVIPHANTGLFDFDTRVDTNMRKDDQYWLAGTSNLLLRCDFVYCPYNWGDCTEGMRQELELASENCIPVYNSLSTLVNRELRERETK